MLVLDLFQTLEPVLDNFRILAERPLVVVSSSEAAFKAIMAFNELRDPILSNRLRGGL
jgi:hypothetical protein